MILQPPRVILADLFHVAVAAADPMLIVPGFLPEKPRGRTVVVGAGKASARMALAFERAWDAELSGVVVTAYGHEEPCERIRVLQAAHPVPDSSGVHASQALLAAVRNLGPDDLVVALMSGGGSSLLPAPPSGVSLADEQALNAQLLRSGLPIGEMNLIRRHVSRIKGGRLATAAGAARVVTLVLSDIPGDDPAQVASGPTIIGDGTSEDALALVHQTGLALPPAILEHLHAQASVPMLAARPQDDVHVIGSAALSLAAAERHARDVLGVPARVLSDRLEGEARTLGREHARLAMQAQAHLSEPMLLLSGGETSVTIEGQGGRGGRNTEFAVAMVQEFAGAEAIHALSADTDGVDGSSDGAGGFADGTSAARMQQQGYGPAAVLASHQTGAALKAIGDLFVTGPTRTNVNDFRAILIGPP